jgi:hypothetical protein
MLLRLDGVRRPRVLVEMPTLVEPSRINGPGRHTSFHGPQILSLSLYLNGYTEASVSSRQLRQLPIVVLRPRTAAGPQPSLVGLKASEPRADASALPGLESSSRRTKIWEMHTTLHCSIVGTCLSTGELRRLLIRLRVAGVQTASDHDVHMLGVMLAERPKAGARELQKALDRRHQPAVHRFAKAKTADAISALWEDALQSGDIPGAYWALLSHPAATDAIIKHAFGDVHMLSHLIGAANRADIRRLRALEAENGALTVKLERQQRQLRDGFTGRDQTIRRLSDLLAQSVGSRPGAQAPVGEDERIAMREAIAELNQRFEAETTRRKRLEERLAVAMEARVEAARTRHQLERQCEALSQELAAVEIRIGLLIPSREGPTADPAHLCGRSVLYVGGRAHQIPQCRAIVERYGGVFLHHDAGVEHNAALLPGLISRADIVLFPVDCVSHDAVAVVKRSCGQLGKRLMPLRTSSLACLISALAAVEPGGEAHENHELRRA